LQIRGAIYHHSNLLFHNGFTGKKYLILLNTPRGKEPYLFVKSTSQKKEKPSTPNCIKDRSLYFIPAGKRFFKKDTWILKWTPVEHRLHSEISKNWAGKPLKSYETVLKYIRRTKTSTGLKVNAHFVRKHYKLGQKVTDEQMESISIVRHDTFPNWNYTIKPR
jgi:hypothetical protein